MAIISCNELFEGRTASDTTKRRRTYVRKWEIITDNAYDDPGFVASYIGTPRLGQPYITSTLIDSAALVVEVTAEQDSESPFRWIVTTKYDTELEFKNAIAPAEAGTSPPSPGGQPNNPTSRAPTFGVTTTKIKEIPTTAFDQEDPPNIIDVLNSSGLPFDPPYEDERSLPVLTIVVNVPTFNLTWYKTYVDSVNSHTWLGFEPRVCKLDDVSSQSQYDNGVAFVTVTQKIPIKWDTWDVRILDAGMYRKGTTPEGGGLFPILDKAGRPIADPVPLDGNGQRLAAGDNPVYLRFRIRPERNWVGNLP